jgi:hypothetical protein
MSLTFYLVFITIYYVTALLGLLTSCADGKDEVKDFRASSELFDKNGNYDIIFFEKNMNSCKEFNNICFNIISTTKSGEQPTEQYNMLKSILEKCAPSGLRFGDNKEFTTKNLERVDKLLNDKNNPDFYKAIGMIQKAFNKWTQETNAAIAKSAIVDNK